MIVSVTLPQSEPLAIQTLNEDKENIKSVIEESIDKYINKKLYKSNG